MTIGKEGGNVCTILATCWNFQISLGKKINLCTLGVCACTHTHTHTHRVVKINDICKKKQGGVVKFILNREKKQSDQIEVSAVETEVVIVPGEDVVRINRQAPFMLELGQSVAGSPARPCPQLPQTGRCSLVYYSVREDYSLWSQLSHGKVTTL